MTIKLTRALRKFIYTFEKGYPPTHPSSPLSLSLPPSPSLSNRLHPKKFLKKCQVFIFPRTLLPSFPLSLTSHSLSFSFLCAVQIRCQSISASGEVKEHRTFLLKLVLFFPPLSLILSFHLSFSTPSLIDLLSFISSSFFHHL